MFHFNRRGWRRNFGEFT